MSAVPVFWSKSLGAKSDGLGNGRLVKAGLMLRADEIARSAEDGQMIVMSCYICQLIKSCSQDIKGSCQRRKYL